jgi:hypothetical protein
MRRYIDGSFTFVNGTSVYPDAGQNQSFRVTFTPAYESIDNDNDFAATTANITVNVAKAPATLGFRPNASPIYADQTLRQSNLTGGSVLGVNQTPLGGSFDWQTPSATYTTGNVFPTVTFDYSLDADRSNYLPFTTAANLSVIASTSNLNEIINSSGSTAFDFLEQLASTTPPRNTIMGTTGTSYAFMIGDSGESAKLTNTNSFMKRITATSSDPDNRIVVGTSTNGIIVLEFDKDGNIITTQATTIIVRLATRYKTIYLREGSSGPLIKRVHKRNGRSIEFQTRVGVSEYTFATSLLA